MKLIPLAENGVQQPASVLVADLRAALGSPEFRGPEPEGRHLQAVWPRARRCIRKLLAALADTTAAVVVPSRHAALRRVRHGRADLKYARARRAAVEAEMTVLLEELGFDHARICQNRA